METVGIDEAALQQSVLIAVIGSLIVFFVIAPIGGRFLHQWVGRHMPEHSALALLGIGLIVFLLSAAIVLGLLLRLGLGLEAVIVLSLTGGLLAVVIMVLAVRVTIRRTTPPGIINRETPDVQSGAWGVWGEDARSRSKNLRKPRR